MCCRALPHFKMRRVLENLHCHVFFCPLILTLSNLTQGAITDDFQDFVFLSCTAQNICIPCEKQVRRDVKKNYLIDLTIIIGIVLLL